jgi:PHD/YefM family antitoxin component YafN of YafNO toxin-antitoxin module
LIPKTISPTELRQNLYEIVREIGSKGHRYLVTPNEGEAVVMCSREDFNGLLAKIELLRDIRCSEADIKAGRTYSTAEVRESIERKKRQHGKSKRP